MTEILIRAERLTKVYGSGEAATHALRGASLEIARGSFTCIVGPSGHGKSTLLQLLGGLDRPSSGSIVLDDIDLTTLSPKALAALRGEKIGFVFQSFNLLRHLDARENIETALLMAGNRSVAHGSRALELLQQVGLEGKAAARPHQLSGGQQQRVAVARALANDPALLLMDEPTGNLDSQAEAEVVALLKGLHARGKTLVIVTHNRELARQAERIVEVRDGLIAA